MTSQQVLVKYILHNKRKLQNDKDNVIDTLTNKLFQSDIDQQILGKLSKNISIAQVRKKYNFDLQKIRFIKKTYSKIKKLSLSRNIEQDKKQQNPFSTKFQFVNINGQQTIKLMQIFDYSYTIQNISQSNFLTNLSYQTSTNTFLIHLCNIIDVTQPGIAKMSMSPLFGQPLNGSDNFEGVKKKEMDINSIINENMNMIQKIVESNGKIDANNDFNVVNNGNTNNKNTAPNLNSNSTNTNPNANKFPPTNAKATLTNDTTNNSTNPASKPQNSPSPAGNSGTTNTNTANTVTNPIVPNNQAKDPTKLGDTLIKKVYRATTKQQMLSTLKLAKATHRSYHNNKQIKQRTIVDFQNSKIQLINAYKNYFYQRQLTLKDEIQAQQFKKSINSLDFKIDVGAPNRALDQKIGLAMINTKSQENHLLNSQFTQIHIAFSFQQAFLIEPDNIKLTQEVKAQFKQLFLKYMVKARKSNNQIEFYNKEIQTLDEEFKKDLNRFYEEFGSQIEVGTFIFGGKYLAETNFKFLANLDIKSKQKVRTNEGNFTIQGGQVTVGLEGTIKNEENFKTSLYQQNVIISRNYILYPGSNKNLIQWNTNLQNSRQDWKLVLKDTKRVFIGQILGSKINTEQFLMIEPSLYGNFLQKIKNHFQQMNGNNSKIIDQNFKKFKERKLFILWKEQLIKNLRVMKLTLIERRQKKLAQNKDQKLQNKQPTSQRQLKSNNRLQDLNNEYVVHIPQRKKLTNNKTPPPFYVMVCNRQISQAYPQLLRNAFTKQQSNQIYDSGCQSCLFKYLLCCFARPKKQPTNKIDQKRRTYAKYFSDIRTDQSVGKSITSIYNMQFQNQFNLQKKDHQNLSKSSTILTASYQVKHIFDIEYEHFEKGIIQNLMFKTVPKRDFFNRAYRYEIYLDLQFQNKGKGILSMLDRYQQQNVIVTVKNIRKVNLIGQVLQNKVDCYDNLFYNDQKIQHYMKLEKLYHIG